jgi:hypothetical protein
VEMKNILKNYLEDMPKEVKRSFGNDRLKR